MKLNAIFLLAIFLLSGCYDRGYLPKIRNEYPDAITVSVMYTNGEKVVFQWPSCRTIFLGKKDLEIQEISVESGKDRIQTFDRRLVYDLIERQPISSLLVLSSRGLEFSDEKGCGQENQ